MMIAAISPADNNYLETCRHHKMPVNSAIGPNDTSIIFYHTSSFEARIFLRLG